ncbi:tRNA pseudouridine synthase [Toxoplasma gondii VEG]|uniref:Pseudouridylate synthase, related n=1 Tax=Toxoplasma gondii (strain ATCC 50861 / VEG) TaxID=432359 RepID=B9Q7G7_TOXGV|nr:tRNA pseudouridine synthase [Toxoplasma gondii VEG]CEL76680.1 TPA: Pseudouridylate synthase, related [Toxoplasma gondii VEG]
MSDSNPLFADDSSRSSPDAVLSGGRPPHAAPQSPPRQGERDVSPSFLQTEASKKQAEEADSSRPSPLPKLSPSSSPSASQLSPSTSACVKGRGEKKKPQFKRLRNSQRVKFLKERRKERLEKHSEILALRQQLNAQRENGAGGARLANEEADGETPESKAAPPSGRSATPRVPKKKYALLFGYNGENFHGLQKQMQPLDRLLAVHQELAAASLANGSSPLDEVRDEVKPTPAQEASFLKNGDGSLPASCDPSAASASQSSSCLPSSASLGLSLESLEAPPRTVEGVLEEALLASGGIAPYCLGCLQKLQWSRAARTDRGVHAACNVVSLKLSLGPVSFRADESGSEDGAAPGEDAGRRGEEEGEEEREEANEEANEEADGEADGEEEREKADKEAGGECGDNRKKTSGEASVSAATSNATDLEKSGSRDKMREKSERLVWQREREVAFLARLNAALPPDIRCFAVRRVTKNFDARVSCSRRRYAFLLPAWLLQPIAVRRDVRKLLSAYQLRCSLAPSAASPASALECVSDGGSGCDRKRERADEGFLAVGTRRKTGTAAEQTQTRGGETLEANPLLPAPVAALQPLSQEAKRQLKAALELSRAEDGSAKASPEMADSNPDAQKLSGVRTPGGGRETETGSVSSELQRAAETVKGEGRFQLGERLLGGPPPVISALALQENGEYVHRSAFENDDQTVPTPLSTAELVEKLRAVFKVFEGTHAFQNFTKRGKHKDSSPAAFKRHIHRTAVSQAHLDGVSDDVVVIELEGQSFLFNQIRKMVGIAVEVCRGTATVTSLTDALRPNRQNVFIHTAPAEGLLLLSPVYDTYNRTRAAPPELPAVEVESIQEEILSFQRSAIFPRIAHSFSTTVWNDWIENINWHPFFLENISFGDARDLMASAPASKTS